MNQPTTHISSNFTGIPDELRQRVQWVTHREKQPYKATMSPKLAKYAARASSTEPTSWSTFDQAVECAAAGGFDGIGFVFAAGGGLVGVDLDKCVSDGKVHPEAQAVIDALDSWWEMSPSGTGVHVIARGHLPGGKGRKVTTTAWGGALEMYDRGRYFTVVGRGRGELADAQAAIDELLERMPDNAGEAECGDWDFDGDDAALLKSLCQDRRFAKLYDGHGVTDHSSADYSLCCRVAEHTGDPDRIARIWANSALGKRQKFGRRDYRERTIHRAIAASAGERWASSSFRPSLDHVPDGRKEGHHHGQRHGAGGWTDNNSVTTKSFRPSAAGTRDGRTDGMRPVGFGGRR